MKKLLLIITCLFCMTTTFGMADDDRPIRVEQLPAKAQQFIKTHFADSRIAISKVDTDWFDKTYEVIFTNGDKIEFNRSGEWKDIDCKHSAVPEAAVPEQIKNYIRTNYQGAVVLSLEKDKNSYDVKLSNRVELEFDKWFNLIDIDM